MHETINARTGDLDVRLTGTSDDVLAAAVDFQRTADGADLTSAVPASPHDLGERDVAQLSTMAAKLLAADGCMIMLIDGAGREPLVFRSYASGLPRCDATKKRWIAYGETAAREAIRAGKALLIDVPGVGCKLNTRTRAASPVHRIVASPIIVRDDIVGALTLVSGGDISYLSPDGPAALEIVATLVGQAPHALRLETLLTSRFAQLAIVAEAGCAVGQALALAGSRPELARILAKSFYREMVKLGCESGQIIAAAAEIISQLSASLKRHRDCWQRRRPSNDGEAVATK
jgi:L-methionine (R)-S-oxide reductase